jgi:ribosomal protein L3 glutamine methyltransferase
MRIEDCVRQISDQLEQAGLYFGHGTETAWDEAVWLLLHVLGVSPVQEIAADLQISDEDFVKAKRLADERVGTRKPLAYLINSAWFCGHEFYVDERVLVPRSPIAELIVQQFSPWLAEPPRKVLDLCTGSACIAVACCLEFPDAQLDASDIDESVLQVAAANVERYQLSSRINLIQSDVYSSLAGRQYDLIVSNPPYVDAEDMSALPQEFHREPELALAAGCDGLDIVRKILGQALEFLTPAGILICEVGNSEPALNNAYPTVPFTWLQFDHGGQGVFLLTAEELKTFNNEFKAN